MEIIYEDREIVVCHKEPGVPVQTKAVGQQDMVSRLKNYFADKGGNTEIFVIRRLDQPVEGIMVFARSSQAAAVLNRQVQERSVEKSYFAIIEGEFEKPTGILENYLLRDGKSNTSKVVSKETKGAKLARLSYEVKKVITKSEGLSLISGMWRDDENEAVSLLHVYLDTGRHHQIRVQMAHAGHPLVGDKKYNKNCPKGYLPIGLCSVKTSFFHPRTGERMEFAVKPKGALFAKLL
ncbi:MAG: RluA family pseudouridine synthase [Lachnospiraceae bacterium]|nr:RluA family pseudouridine synthase [Lachnospiraceae bacterium]